MGVWRVGCLSVLSDVVSADLSFDCFVVLVLLKRWIFGLILSPSGRGIGL